MRNSDTPPTPPFPPPEAIDPPKNGSWFADWLRQRRFSNVQIAERLGVTPMTIYNYTRSLEPLKPAVLLALDAVDAADAEDRQRLRNSEKIVGGGA